ncbi:DUF2834 domain-containing protein [Leptothoe sp. ISB3NOV94-8A]|uniref:DUF2834 domain-containing protein n=1 Tax=Adonisia turfae CCMR0081 TaxID=2292702 RepID=A0A6M0REU4_9CYAN|nr:DUF2834 domain-containing protein [Adonisia turfae]MDV3349767.1 DUF2834 domain-containing protein [Leptothoe sp. LEGE 181152]NEZ54768.1 DUF2834 domain-containing protein [Adonisia turfae CCMR0081]
MMSTISIQQSRPLRCKLYLTLTVIGSILPWIFLDQFLFSGTASASKFFAQAFSTPVGIALTVDLSISCLVFFCFAWFELSRIGLSRRWLWLYLGCTLGVGLSCSLPLFLYMRERQLGSLGQ